jgi:hypothetical protein
VDFKSETRAATVRALLHTLRQAIKNSRQTILMNCAVKESGKYFIDPVNLLYNDITFAWVQTGKTEMGGTCTTDEISKEADRRIYVGGGAKQHIYEFPRNPLASETATIQSVDSDTLKPFANHCAAADGLASRNGKEHFAWIYNYNTGEIFAGTHTSGLDECNL